MISPLLNFMVALCVTAHAYSRTYFGFFAPLDHRAAAALLALAFRWPAVSFLARALPPFNPPSRPSATAAAFFFVFAMPDGWHKPVPVESPL
jgi:hypothetical protein